jgi:hypothetical protein
VRGLVFVLLGTFAVLLTGFAPRDIAAAFRRAFGGATEGNGRGRPGRVLEAAARNALSLGVLATLIGVVQLVQSFEGAPAQFLALIAGASSPAFYGLAVAALFGVASASVRAREKGSGALRDGGAIGDGGRPAGSSAARWLGHLAMPALLLWIILSSAGSRGLGPWLDSWPAWSMVLGGTLFLALVHGRAGTGDGLTLGFSCSGLIAASWALLQTLGAFSGNSIPWIAAAMGGVTTSWFVCLAGLLLAAFPLADRASQHREPSPPARAAWYLVPLLVLSFLVITLLLVMTPIEKQA